MKPSSRSSRTAVSVSAASRSAMAAASRCVERPKIVQTRSTRQFAANAPKAELKPGCGGIRTRVMPSSRAQALPWTGPAPPKGMSTNSLRIEPAIDRDQLHLVGHVLVGRLDDGVGGNLRRLGRLRAQRLSDCLQRRDRRLRLEGDLAAEEIVGIEAAEDEIGVGHGRLRAALAVADRPGIGAGAARSDLEQPALVDPGDAAAAGAERGHIDAGDGYRYAEADLELALVALLAALDGADVRAGAAHVEREGMLDAGQSGVVAGGDDAAGQARDEELRRLCVGGVDAQVTAIRLQHAGRSGDAEIIEGGAHAGDIVAQHRLDIGVADGGAAAFVLAPGRGDLVRDGDGEHPETRAPIAPGCAAHARERDRRRTGRRRPPFPHRHGGATPRRRRAHRAPPPSAASAPRRCGRPALRCRSNRGDRRAAPASASGGCRAPLCRAGR